jgi:TonB family protein
MRNPALGLLAFFLSLALWAGNVRADPPTPTAVSFKVVLSGRYINFADADVKPKPIHLVNPIYPADFRAAGIAGWAVTEFIVDENGTPTQVQIVRASDREFADAALVAMKQWRFSPGIKNAVAVRCREQIPMEFKPKK